MSGQTPRARHWADLRRLRTDVKVGLQREISFWLVAIVFKYIFLNVGLCAMAMAIRFVRTFAFAIEIEIETITLN